MIEQSISSLLVCSFGNEVFYDQLKKVHLGRDSVPVSVLSV